ncbi:hypothetical protein E4633_07865 [Geomonas terrae]|uniref:DUF2007 domain-containing protein n=1 Tax=Geomonas terrae TaxID=2562681 RepID=A0A4S1CGK4_9BACT|nr:MULTISPECIES: DUF2007 domain-containing protein [Geomonas]TGU72220.1 hypothetical protein E4633_07865 [Geomonas terrae]
MVKFYDAKTEADLSRVETVLKQAGIEYSVSSLSEPAVSGEIEVAEEDLPKAEELLLKNR